MENNITGYYPFRIAMLKNCIIYEKSNSRCEKYLRGECNKCLDHCAYENWAGWDCIDKCIEHKRK